MEETAKQVQDDTSELQFCQETMNVLCGEQEVPFRPGTVIKDRSVHPEFSQRDLAMDYIRHVIENMKFPVPVKVEVQGIEQDYNVILSNLIVTVEGTEVKDKAVIVGAHYDVQNNLSFCWHGTKGDYKVTSGADDNTSGTVGCLALLRRFTKSPPKKTTKIVWFDGEEPGEYNSMAVGSEYFVKQLPLQTESLSFSSAVIVDMIGGPPTVAELGFVISTSKQVDNEALQQSTQSINCGTTITVANYQSKLNCLRLTDSVHFPKIGLPTVLLSNIGGYSTVPPFYHTEDDTVDVINWETFLQAVDVLEYLVRNEIPVLTEEVFKANPELLTVIMAMGFKKEQAEFALISSKNNLDAAIDILTL